MMEGNIAEKGWENNLAWELLWTKPRYDLVKKVIRNKGKINQLIALIRELTILQRRLATVKNEIIDASTGEWLSHILARLLPLPTVAIQPFLIWSRGAPSNLYSRVVYLYSVIKQINESVPFEALDPSRPATAPSELILIRTPERIHEILILIDQLLSVFQGKLSVLSKITG